MGSCSEGGFTRRKEQVCPRQILTRGRLLRNVQRRPDPSSEESERQPDAGTLPRRRSASCLRGFAARSPSTICVGGRGSSPTPTMHGRRSSWRQARRGSPVTRCGTPPSRRYRRSGERTQSSRSWWRSCPWRDTVLENGYSDTQCRRRYQRMSATENGGGTGQGGLFRSSQVQGPR